LAFWKKLLQPVTTAALVFVAISFIFGPLRSVTLGQRVFTGVLVGFSFRILQDLLGPSSLVFGFSPLIAVVAPILMLVVMGMWVIRRAGGSERSREGGAHSAWNSIIQLVLDVPRGERRSRAGRSAGTLGGTSTSSSSNLSPGSGLGQYHGTGAGGDIRPGAGLLVPQRPPDAQPATQPADQRDAYPVDCLTAGDGGAVGLL